MDYDHHTVVRAFGYRLDMWWSVSPVWVWLRRLWA